ncbi:MAG: ACP S-malonyltransferase [Acidobacteria bacterium]|nr:ACP S-malonyltransferase [Acidobacteriota bacterium]
MEITILLDHNLDGHLIFLEAGMKETGWDQIVTLDFKRLRDFGLPNDSSDQEIWRFVQQRRLLLLTHNRNSDDETSLQITIRRENTLDSLPVITVSNKEDLALADYRQRVIHKLVEYAVDLDRYLGVGRLYIP